MVAELRADEPFDVLVIGGGITGVGVALDAAARGLRTALVERDDFASGTSSKARRWCTEGCVIYKTETYGSCMRRYASVDG